MPCQQLCHEGVAVILFNRFSKEDLLQDMCTIESFPCYLVGGGGGDSLNVFLISFLMIFEKPLIIHRTPLSLSEQKDFSQFQHCSQSLQILSNDDHKVQSHDRPLPRIVFLLTLAIVD